MIILKAIAVVIVNFIQYLSFGSFFCIKKDRKWSLPLTLAVGFFAYYAAFAIVALPVMLTYRPLSQLAYIWLAPCVIVPVISARIYKDAWNEKLTAISSDNPEDRVFLTTVFAVTALSVILAVITYNFTLDAAYYVAQVTTNVDTDMINVYDPFTGLWQDHFELRYVFATYYTYDAVVCRLTGIPALVATKSVMSACVMIIVCLLYAFISRYMFRDGRRAALMYVLMTAVNFLFISLYTTSNFLIARTYEGKSVVGNISIVLIFPLYMMFISEEGSDANVMIKLFIVCLGTATVSSTANMVIPALVFSLFVPYALAKKRYAILPKICLCIIPELVMMLIYVLYVKGYFAIYTYPR